ncbi:MAG: acylglycerol kinase family protein, partial [Candidatus Thermoplasmatota archaeon]|nr:acylglycerol kinase family protein [Candidatus Thermoplasmatota archaeon]
MRLVVNPLAAGGRVGRVWPSVERGLKELVSDLEVVFTQGPGTATTLVREAIRSGGRDVGIVGGDGSVNEALNGMMEGDALVDASARLTILPVVLAGSILDRDEANDPVERDVFVASQDSEPVQLPKS